jgi:hypothetical protein
MTFIHIQNAFHRSLLTKYIENIPPQARKEEIKVRKLEA